MGNLLEGRRARGAPRMGGRLLGKFGRCPVPRAMAAAAAERMYSIAEVAALWSVSRDTIERLVARREIRFVVVSERKRIPQSALDEYRDAHEERV